jgi:hypothetical protein
LAVAKITVPFNSITKNARWSSSGAANSAVHCIALARGVVLLINFALLQPASPPKPPPACCAAQTPILILHSHAPAINQSYTCSYEAQQLNHVRLAAAVADALLLASHVITGQLWAAPTGGGVKGPEAMPGAAAAATASSSPPLADMGLQEDPICPVGLVSSSIRQHRKQGPMSATQRPMLCKLKPPNVFRQHMHICSSTNAPPCQQRRPADFHVTRAFTHVHVVLLLPSGCLNPP